MTTYKLRDFALEKLNYRGKYWTKNLLLKSIFVFKDIFFFFKINAYTKFLTNSYRYANKINFASIFTQFKITSNTRNMYNNPYYTNYVYSTSSDKNRLSLILEKFFFWHNFLSIVYTNKTFFPSNKLANINFLRKERLYTKLKYSRSPAYDIVSGGSAALLAAFLGFLISEKYGFELVDSGDFYYFFLYLVFIAFTFKALYSVYDTKNSWIRVLSLKLISEFLLNFSNLFFRLLR